MAGMLDLFGQPARSQVAVSSQGASHHHCIVASWIFKFANVPKSVRAIVRECLLVQAYIIGLAGFGAHAAFLSAYYGQLAGIDKFQLQAPQVSPGGLGLGECIWIWNQSMRQRLKLVVSIARVGSGKKPSGG